MTGGHADVFTKSPLSTRFTSLTCHTYEPPRRRFPSGDEMDNSLDKPAAFAILPVTGGVSDGHGHKAATRPTLSPDWGPSV